MHNLVATGPYPPGQLPVELDPVELVDPHAGTGLGFVPAALAVAQGAKDSGFLDDIGGFFSGIFGGSPESGSGDAEALSEWAADVAAGAAVCASGRVSRDVSYESFGVPIHEGKTFRFDVREVREAIRNAPRGEPGDDPGTVEGLRTAILLPGLPGAPGQGFLEPFIRTDDALARVAVGVAHGRMDCGIGWHEEPAAIHLTRLVEDYRSRPRALPALLPAATRAGLAPGGDMGGLGFLVPLALIGAGLFVATKGMR